MNFDSNYDEPYLINDQMPVVFVFDRRKKITIE